MRSGDITTAVLTLNLGKQYLIRSQHMAL